MTTANHSHGNAGFELVFEVFEEPYDHINWNAKAADSSLSYRVQSPRVQGGILKRGRDS